MVATHGTAHVQDEVGSGNSCKVKVEIGEINREILFLILKMLIDDVNRSHLPIVRPYFLHKSMKS